MTEDGSVIAMSELEPPVAPATVVTSQHGDIDMTELEPSGSQPCDESTHKEPTDDERTSTKKNGDQLSGNQPNRDQAIDDQPMGDQPTDDQPMCDQSNKYQPNVDQLTDGQTMGNQPTDNKSTDATYSDVSLLAEVQKCPVIFNIDYKEYLEQANRRTEWESVCEGLFPQWSTFSPSKKNELSRGVQNKWTKIREPYFKSCVGKIERQIHMKNLDHPPNFFNSLSLVTACAAMRGLDEAEAMIAAQEHARKHPEENARKDQNASREEKHVHGMNPIPKKIPMEEIIKQIMAPFTSAQFNKNQGHISVIPTAAVPSTSAQFNQNQGHISVNPTAAVPSTSAQFNQNQGHISVNPMAAVPSTSAQFNQNQGHISVIPTAAVPSTSAQFNENQGHIREMQTTTAQNNQGQNDLVMPSPSTHQTISCASFLCAMLDNLDYDQQCAVWPNLVALLNNASKSKPKKIKILQSELLNPGNCGAARMPATGSEVILQEPFTDPELEGQEPFAGPELVEEEPFADPELVAREPFADSGLVAQEPLAGPELGNQQALSEKRVDQETMTELDETEEECIYPSSHGRPTNAQGEIIYPETDHEDLDED